MNLSVSQGQCEVKTRKLWTSSVSNDFYKFQTQFQNEKSSESKVDKETGSHQDLAMASSRPQLDGVLALLIGFFAFILGFAMQDTFWGFSIIVVFIREAVPMMKLTKKRISKETFCGIKFRLSAPMPPTFQDSSIYCVCMEGYLRWYFHKKKNTYISLHKIILFCYK